MSSKPYDKPYVEPYEVTTDLRTYTVNVVGSTPAIKPIKGGSRKSRKRKRKSRKSHSIHF